MKKAALVLSGGGARGLAHIGVIEEFVKFGYEITSISGTSMGAMVGGVYALGKMEQFKDWMYTLDKKKVFNLIDFSFSSQGLVKGDKVLKALHEFIDDANIEDLSIPFAATACDLINRKEVVFRTGSIYDAVRASVAIPMVLTPIKKDDGLLVDGGVMNNIPISNIERTKGDTLIVVDVNARIPMVTKVIEEVEEKEIQSIYMEKVKYFQQQFKKISPLHKREGMGYFNLMESTLGLMMFHMSQLSLKQYSPDILINVSRDSCGTYDFFKAKEQVELGRLAAENVLQAIGK